MLRGELARRWSWFCVRREQNTGLDLNRSRLAPVAWVRRRLYFCDTADAGQSSLLNQPTAVKARISSSQSCVVTVVQRAIQPRSSPVAKYYPPHKKCKFLLQPLTTFQRPSLSPSLDCAAAFPASLLGYTPHQEQPTDRTFLTLISRDHHLWSRLHARLAQITWLQQIVTPWAAPVVFGVKNKFLLIVLIILGCD